MTNQWQRWAGIMKCVPFEEKRLAKWESPYIVQPKYDGDRCRNEPAQDTSILLTSEENPYFSVPHINQQLKESNLYGISLDGELYNHDLFLEGGHELIHSICSRTKNIHPRHRDLDFYVVDLKIPDVSQMDRLITLMKVSKAFPKSIKLAPFWICETLSEIKKVYDILIEQKYEGIIVRHIYNLYEEKRSTFMMKFKPKRKDLYTIVGWKEEISKDGVPKGRIGSIVMSSQAGDEFAVSAGLDDEDRVHLWKIRGLLKGLTAIVHYQHLNNKKIPKGTFDLEIPELGV